MNVYQGLFNTTDINADNIFADNAIFNNVTLLGNVKTDLAPLKVVITNVNQELNTMTYTAMKIPNTLVFRDSNGDIIVGGLTADDLHINNSIDVKKLEIEPNVNGEVFTIYDIGSNKIFYVNTNTKVAEIFGSLVVHNYLICVLNATFQGGISAASVFLPNLTANQLVVTDSMQNLASTLVLPDSCSANLLSLLNPVITLSSVNQLLRTNGSGLVYGSNTLPDNCSANNFTITNPHINFVTTNSVLMTNGSGYAYVSNTLPDISTGTILPVFASNNLGGVSNRWNYIYVKSGDFYSIDSGNILPSLGLTYDLGKVWKFRKSLE